jgi:hypothetical protein
MHLDQIGIISIIIQIGIISTVIHPGIIRIGNHQIPTHHPDRIHLLKILIGLNPKIQIGIT